MKGRQQRGTYDSAVELRKIGTSIGDIAGMASCAATDIDALRARVTALEADKARLVAALERSLKDYVDWRASITAYHESGSTSHAVAAERRLDDAMKAARAELDAVKEDRDG